MKKIISIFLMIFLLSGCSYSRSLTTESDSFTPSPASNTAKPTSLSLGDDTSTDVEAISRDIFENSYHIGEDLKNPIRELWRLWKEFDSQKKNDKDPTEDFKNSEYLAKIKEFFGQRESVEISIWDLAQILQQYGMEATDKKLTISEKEYTIRVISYNVDYYVQAITDIVDIPDKWIFVQCWSEDEFYFKTISDGNIHLAKDFLPLNINNKLHIVIEGYSCPWYPYSPFLWAWSLEKDGFYPSEMFPLNSFETDIYEIIDTIDFAGQRKKKWTFGTNGSFFFAEKRSSAAGSEEWPSDYLNILCKLDAVTNGYVFTSLDRDGSEESKIQIILQNGKFVIE